MPRRTRFTRRDSVDIWDARFRWRLGNDLRERTIDETWSRVAEFAISHEGANGGYWKRQYCAAFRQWQWLPDERLLAHADTGTDFRLDEPTAALNASVFVLDSGTHQARFDFEAFAASAAVAVRFLDGAVLAMPVASGRPPDLRIGMIGVGDALAELGIPYDSAGALCEAGAMAHALAKGCLQASVGLAFERGPHPELRLSWLTPALRARRMPSSLIDDVHRHGVRHLLLTAIEPHPLLALLANDTSDALAPSELSRYSAQGRLDHSPTRGPEMAMQPLLAMQRAVQPWIDARIGAPVEPAEYSCASNA